MPKFSIIIPVYNVEDYIEKCLNSVFDQTFKDYEVIVVNDGTKDKSMDIVKKFDVKVINQKNQGLSEARNTGVKEAKGEYILFLDSDDFIEKDLLERLNESSKNNPDIIRFQICEVKDNLVIHTYYEDEFNNLSGEDAFKRIVNYHFVENAWCYAIKRKFYIENKFSFKKGTLHEDFGLIPLVIIKAKIVNSIDYLGYNYVQRESSIMNTKDYQKTIKKVKDMYNHYLYLDKEIDKLNIDKTIIKSFIANSLLIKICQLNGKEYKEYKKLLKENNVYNNLLDNTLARKLKKFMFKISPKLTIKFIK